MSVKTKYRVVTGSTEAHEGRVIFEREIERLMDKGWKLQGGLITVIETFYPVVVDRNVPERRIVYHLSQALTREEVYDE